MLRRRKQDGYAMLVVLLVFSVMIIGLAHIAFGWKTAIQRERETRAIDYAREYRTGIRRYYHKYGRYPGSLEQLTQKDGFNLRYLRENWPDPLSQKPEEAPPSNSSLTNSDSTGGWLIIHYGQAVNAEIVDQPPQAAMQGNPGLGGVSGPGLGSAPGGLAGGVAPVGGNPVAGGSSPIGLPGGQTGQPGAPGGPSGGPGAFGNGPGGGPIIGVASSNKDAAVHEFNGFDTPDHWQFVYNFAQDRSLVGGGAAGGAGGIGAPGGLTPTPGTPGSPGIPTAPPGGRGGGNY